MANLSTISKSITQLSPNEQLELILLRRSQRRILKETTEKQQADTQKSEDFLAGLSDAKLEAFLALIEES